MIARALLVYTLAVLAVGCADGMGDIGIDGAATADGGRAAADAGIASDAAPVADAASDASAMVIDGATSRDGSTSDGGPADAAGALGDAGSCEIGQLCSDVQPCPGDLRCYGFGGDGFCAPFAPECGGFVMTECEAGRRCIRGGGGDLGYCAVAAEQLCICASAEEHDITTDGC
jgi:hypothetical protein